jgi:hypothetical protein
MSGPPLVRLLMFIACILPSFTYSARPLEGITSCLPWNSRSMDFSFDYLRRNKMINLNDCIVFCCSYKTITNWHACAEDEFSSVILRLLETEQPSSSSPPRLLPSFRAETLLKMHRKPPPPLEVRAQSTAGSGSCSVGISRCAIKSDQ